VAVLMKGYKFNMVHSSLWETSRTASEWTDLSGALRVSPVCLCVCPVLVPNLKTKKSVEKPKPGLE